jgi:hypothetical protein
MVLQKMKYTMMQETKQEQELLAEGESNLKLPLSENNFIDKASIINNEAGKLNVDIAVEECTQSDGVRIVSDEGLSD